MFWLSILKGMSNVVVSIPYGIRPLNVCSYAITRDVQMFLNVILAGHLIWWESTGAQKNILSCIDYSNSADRTGEPCCRVAVGCFYHRSFLLALLELLHMRRKIQRESYSSHFLFLLATLSPLFGRHGSLYRLFAESHHSKLPKKAHAVSFSLT